MWREEILRLYPSAQLGEGASELEILDLEQRLSQSLPGDLRDLLLEANGVCGQYGVDVVWAAERIVRENCHFRSDSEFVELYAPFRSLIFFADNGGGDQFAFELANEKLPVMVWDHETDERRIVADSLKHYFMCYLGSGGEDWYR